MCGIIGYSGTESGVPLALEALKRLEYRGYDSAGIAAVVNGKIWVRRKMGKIRDLERLLARESPRVTTVVGHTRWATHGKPSDANAHPHFNEHIAVVHNGIIENYLELREALTKQGAVFTSETDTEVVVHLITAYLKKGQGLVGAVRRALNDLRGTFALGIIAVEEPDWVIGARFGSPLVAGIADSGSFIASDIPALVPFTPKVMPLDDGEMIFLRGPQVEVLDFRSGKTHKKTVITVPWDPVSAEKGGYKHFMEKEIFEQPRAVADTLMGRIREHEEVVYLEGLEDEFLAGVKHIRIIACGTSYHSAIAARYWMERFARIPVMAEVASEFASNDIPLPQDTLLIAVSQSGETMDTLSAVRNAKGPGLRTLAVVNILGSSLSRACDRALFTRAGPEIGVAATKTFTAQLALLFALGLKMAQIGGTLSRKELMATARALRGLPAQMEAVLNGEVRTQVATLAKELADRENALYLARGINAPIAREGALKLKEISYIHAEAYPAGEMKHGPIALIDPRLITIFIGPQDRWFTKLTGNIQEVVARGAHPILITSLDNSYSQGVAHRIAVPKTHEWLYPLLVILPLQLLAYDIAVLRGYDVDQPRHLAKTVTVE
ncbi:MAG: glutamine--fructose-6-phosphate transaminase (isomerizing) [bacterium JZ-2024 1]